MSGTQKSTVYLCEVPLDRPCFPVACVAALPSVYGAPLGRGRIPQDGEPLPVGDTLGDDGPLLVVDAYQWLAGDWFPLLGNGVALRPDVASPPLAIDGDVAPRPISVALPHARRQLRLSVVLPQPPSSVHLQRVLQRRVFPLRGHRPFAVPPLAPATRLYGPLPGQRVRELSAVPLFAGVRRAPRPAFALLAGQVARPQSAVVRRGPLQPGVVHGVPSLSSILQSFSPPLVS
ncbi:hypothetical protein PHLGIDRAFT_30547 [Phlebiopsis gigantea 11061_1 CR5-6]|uniref:Uncharacterized protein n=1 Tax=Phlebiopsis gigantea (strain 11061_1 CR5-6) TaxID=745531 RepID=A0A0C3NMQ9_PHLG1|nr:hypothetical protein PHLGIDRAFT_30547 [Phlebiopsis gigantea 11061_1 CR5-6]